MPVAPIRRVPMLPALLLLAVLLAACGDESGLNRNRHDAVFDAAMQAVHDRDLNALWPLLTADGRNRVEKSLRVWQKALSDPEQSARILELAEETLGTLDPAEVERARTGTIEDAWSFFLRADPRQARPAKRGIRVAPDGREVLVEYEGPRATLHQVRLVQRPDGWYIDGLQL